MNLQLFSIILSISSTVLIGVLMVIALVVGFDDIPEIIGVVIVGLIISIPIAYVITKKVNRIKE